MVFTPMSTIRRRGTDKFCTLGVVVGGAVLVRVMGLLCWKYRSLYLVYNILHVELFPKLCSPAPVLVSVLLVEAHKGKYDQ